MTRRGASRRHSAPGGRRRGAFRPELGWLVAWSPMVLVGALAAATGREAAASSLVWVAVVVLVPILTGRLAPGLRIALTVASIAVATVLVAEASLARTTWRALPAQPAATNRVLAAVGPQVLAARPDGGGAERVWRRRGDAGPVTVAFEVMRSEGPAGWSWYAYDPAFVVTPIPDAPGYARVATPPDRGSYVTRRTQTSAPLAGRTFRASLRLRTSEPLVYDERACRGVLLREVGGGGTASCFALAASDEWRAYAFTWQAPAEATSRTIRIEVRIEAAWFEVGDVALEELGAAGWIPLGPLEPAGIMVAAAVPGAPPVEWPTRVLAPGADAWTAQALEFADPRWTDDVRILVRLEPGTTASLRHTTATDDRGRRLRPEPLPARTQGWFGHPNLAGHALASIGLAAVAAAPTAAAAGVVAAASLAGIATTGSRTALVVALLAMGAFVVVRARGPRGAGPPRWRWLVAAVVVAAFGMLSERGSILPSNDGNAVPRSEIWSFAWRAVVDRPLSGLGPTSFREAWIARFPEAPSPAPAHAHNLWLEVGAAQGIVGLALALTWSLLLLRFARRHLGGRGLVVTGALLLLQATDVTLPNAYVYVPYAAWVALEFAERRRSVA